MPRPFVGDEGYSNRGTRRHRARKRRIKILRRYRHSYPRYNHPSPSYLVPDTHVHDSFDYSAKDKAYGVFPQQLLTETDSIIDLENLGEENIVHSFMTEDDSELRLEGQAEPVVSFCHLDALEELQSNSPKLPRAKVCLIDDRTREGLTSRAIGEYKPLTVHEMFTKLLDKRFSLTKPSAHRRLIFVTNLDSHALVALMATAPPSDFHALIDFFYFYIVFQPHIGIFASQPRGFPTFTHSFHLSFYSWKCTNRRPLDPRCQQDKSRLRKVHDMGFLRGKTHETADKVDYLCEAQVSVLVTAIDHKTWTGYCFVDTYYEPEDKRQSVERYCKSGIQADELQLDPFTNGRCDAGKPLLDPCEYFLTALECQSMAFKREWMNTKCMLKKRVEAYIDQFQYTHQSSPAATPLDRQEPLTWLRLTRRTLTDMIMCLDTTISCWDNYAKDQFPSEYGQRCLRSIQHSFLEAKHCLNELKKIRTLCDEHKETLNLYNVNAQNHISELQTKAAQNAQTISSFLLYVLSPVTVAAAMLSMQEKAIPPILGPTKVSFFILTPILTLIMYVMSWMIHSWEKVQQHLAQLVKRHGVSQPEAVELDEVV